MLNINIIFIIICKILSLQNPPDVYQEADNPYRNDIEYTTEKDHHIITAVSSEGYVDYYKGIYYKPYLYCQWRYDNGHYHPEEQIHESIPKYLELQNINDTNLKQLHKIGCTAPQLNLLIDYRRHADDAIVSLTIRFTNTLEEDIPFQLGFCNSYKENERKTCNQGYLQILDEYTVANNSFAVYTFKFDISSYYKQSENFEIPYSHSFPVNDHLRFFILTDEQKLYINSYIVSVDLLRYVLTYSGHAHNYCTNDGCLNSYYCTTTGTPYTEFGYNGKYYGCRHNYYSYFTTECSLFGCIPGAFCSPDNVCMECDYQCRTCFDKTYMNCKSCYSLAIYPLWLYENLFSKGTSCIFEFYPINKAESLNINVPIPLNYRITFEFWIFIHNPLLLTNQDLRSSLSSFILKDFFALSFHQISGDKNSIKYILTPFEYYYPFTEDITTTEAYYDKYKKLYPALKHVEANVYNITSKWFYVKAGISYTHKKMFINEDEIDLYDIPIYDKDEETTYKYMMRKFYRRYDTTYLRIQGFQYINSDVYIRNLNIYSDYMKNNINSPNYFNMHEITDIFRYPQLLLSIPFTNVTIDPTKMFVKYKMYDYSGQYTNLNKNPDEVIINEVKMKLVRDYLAPSKNFYRLNFLKFNNSEFISTDLFDQTLPIECDKVGNGQYYCFEDFQPYICLNSYNLLINCENDTESYCIKDCVQTDEEGKEHKYMRLPNIKIKQRDNSAIPNNLCTYECVNSTVEYCPTKFNENIKNFQCNESYYSYFYQCLEIDQYPAKESALQFSGSMNTKSIYFPFNKDLYEFYIEIWFHTDLLTQEEPPLYNKYLFLTNNQQIYYDVLKQQYMLKVFSSEGTNSNFNLMQKIYYYGWNHLIIYTKEEIIKNIYYTTFVVSLANKLIEIGTIQGRSSANKICFCNTDKNCCDRVTNALWFDLFIKDIKVWNGKYVNFYTMNDYDKFYYVIPGGLLHHYNLTSASLDQNIIMDLRHPNDPNYYAQFPYDDPVINPDGDMNYNIGWNFNWNDLNYPKYIISTRLLTEHTRVEIVETGNCYKGCLQCFGVNKFACYSCQPGYALNGDTCTKTSEELSIYYYVNPLKQGEGLDPDTEMELDFTPLNLDSYATITLFFYFKIYGFTQEQIDEYENGNTNLFKMITFSEPDQFILYYDISTDTVILKLGEDIQYNYTGLLEKYGEWIPVAISAFRTEDYDFRKNFVSMTFKDTLLPYLGFNGGGLYAKFPFKTFKISKYLIAHFADITLYDLFIINAYGYAMHKYTKNSIFEPTSQISRNPIIIKTFKLFHIQNKIIDYSTDSSTSNMTDIPDSNNTDSNTEEITEIKVTDCISPEDIIGAEQIMPRVICKEDYLPYIDQKCKDDELVEFTNPNLPPLCVSSASKCENIIQVTKNMLSNCDYLYASCDTKSSNSINNLIYTYSPRNIPTDKYIVCGDAHGLDLARFEPAIVPNVASPKEGFKMEFWFLSQSYVGNNFKSITIEWVNHMKIEVFYNKENNRYGARCIPMNDEDNKMEFEYEEASYDQNRWRYIVCGVDSVNYKSYLTNLQIENRVEKTFTTSIDLNNADNTTNLLIAENSDTNYGVTYLKELRLWECYDCASDRAFVVYSRDDPFFEDVVNYFKFDSPTGFLQDYHTGYPEPDVSTQFITKTDFNGYGLLEPIPDIPNCNEGGQMYFSIKMGEGCDTMFNFNIFTKDVVFNDLPSSRTNSYTIEFWFYVESADDFTKGINLIYEDHMTISAQSHNINDNDLFVYCFPQAFRDHLDDVFGEDMKKRFDEAQNKYGYIYENGFSKWNYVRCSYSYDLLKYYINDETPKIISSEIFFPGYQNDKPFKMFMNNFAKFKINSSRNNFVRIFIQTINIYRDYIPQTIVTKYLKMDQFITNPSENPYYPILFSVNFPENYDIITDKLKYYITDFDFTPEDNYYLNNFLGEIDSKSYKTYPLYDPFKLCNYGQIFNETKLNCRSIMDPNNCDRVKTFCIDTQKFFWCPSGKYLDINTLQCNRDCPEGYTRPPDIREGFGMCYINATDKHYQTYPRLNADLKADNYVKKFKCEPGFTLVHYNCIPDSKITNSGLYFSSKYKFSNLIASYNKLTIPIVNYYIDFWFLFDLTEEYRFNIPNDKQRYTIFIAYPHFITRFQNKIQYNNGYILLDYYDIINVENIKNKWNHVVLENYQVDGKTPLETFKYINIYWNNDYDNPLLSLKINNLNSYALAQIAFCHEQNDAYSICNLGLNAVTYKVFTPYWDDVYYKDIKVWNRNSTAISSINSFGSPLNNEITMNIISYHPLTIDTIQPGLVKSLVNFMDKDVDFITSYNTERVYDKSQQINWVTDYDITFPDKYIFSLDVSSYTDKVNSPIFSRIDTSFDARQCEGNCYQCFSGLEEDCVSCKTSYLISGSKCNLVTGYYFKIPTANKNAHDKVVLNQNLTDFPDITIIFFMKFIGSIEQRKGIVPILYFYQDKNYLGWDIENQTFIINCIDDSSSSSTEENLFTYENSRLYIGKWSMFSISIHTSQYPTIFPNMIQFMIDENIIEPKIKIEELNKKLIKYDFISINNNMSALFYDLRIYKKYYIGAYGIGQDVSNLAFCNPFLNKSFLFKPPGVTIHDCIQSSEISIGADAQYVGDNNPYENLNCESGEFRIVDSLHNEIECNTCNSYCEINYCTSNTTRNCSCIIDDHNYWIRYDFDEEKQKFYCEKLDSININEYNDIVINNIGVGTETGYTIEFWFYVDTYMDYSNFQGVSIIWEHLIKINIEYDKDNLVKIFCFPNSDNSFSIKDENKYKFKEWSYYICQVDKTGNNVESTYSKVKINIDLWSGTDTTTTLTIKDNSNSPYGIFLLRELRLFNSRDLRDKNNYPAHQNLDISQHISLIHYFKGNFTDQPSPRNILYDYVTNVQTSLTYKISNYPYSYISKDYMELILCEEGYKYEVKKGIVQCNPMTNEDQMVFDADVVFTTGELVSKISNIYNFAVGELNYTETQNKVITSAFNVNNDSKITIQDPTITDSYCSHKGIIQTVITSLACYCIGDAVGQYCHLKSEDYTSLEETYSSMLILSQKTYKKYILGILNQNSEEEKSFISSLNSLIVGNKLYCKDSSFVSEITSWLHKDVIFNIEHCDLDYIKLVDNLFSTLIRLTNTYKAGLISNNKGTKRNANLNLGQQEEIDSNIIKIKKHLEYLTSLCFTDTVDGKWTYKSDNLQVDLFKIPKNGDINIDILMKSLKEENHEPYFQFGECINKVKSLDNSQYINVQYITWIYSPWYHHNTLNYNFSSNYVEIRLYSDSIKELELNDCKDSHITFYLTLTNPDLIDIINNNKFHFKEGNLFKSTDRIFTEPKYILDDGSVSNMTLEERRNKYYFEYLLIYKTLNNKNRELITSNVEYENLEDNLYFRCSSTHLSEYLLTYEYNPRPDKILGRFYFLSHIKLYLNSANLNGNYGFFSIIAIIALYFINFFIVKMCLIIRKKRLGNKNYLLIEDFLIDYVYPYGNIEGDFFVNKDNLNKIYNKNLKIKSGRFKGESKEKIKQEILKMKENIKKTENDEEINTKYETRKNAYLNEENLMNYGDVKNPRIYNQLYNQINEEGYNDYLEEANETLEAKKKEKKEDEEMGEAPSDEKLRNKKIKGRKNTKKKGEFKVKNNYIDEDDKISSEDKEEINEVKEFKKNKIKLDNLIHSLQISNENLRIRILSKMKVNCCEFFCINLKNRLLFFNTFKGNYTYSASIKALYLPLYLLILLFINTFIFICLTDESDYMDYIKGNMGDFLWRCLLPVVVVNVYFYLSRYFYNLDNGDVRYLLYEFKTSKASFDKHYFNKLKKIRNMMIFETILFFIMSILSYIFIFGLFAIYPAQGKTMFVSLICGIAIDLLLSVLVEVFITILFICRKNHVIVILLDYMNRLMSYKMLSP